MTNKRIVFFIPDLRAGGAERVILNVAKCFLQSGLNVTLLLGKKEGKLLNKIPAGLDVIELGSRNSKINMFKFILFCNDFKPDVIIGSLGAVVTMALSKAFISKKVKLICRLGSTLSAEAGYIRSPIKRFIYKFVNKIIYINSDRLICQSEFMKNDCINFLKVDGRKLEVIYNPVDVEKCLYLSKDEAEFFDLIAIGRLMYPKDYITLIQSIEILIDKGIKIKVGIIGEGSLFGELDSVIKAKKLENHIILLGFKENPYSYLSRSKFLISTSIYEGFSNVIIEALVLGIPIIATDCPSGNREVLFEGVNGYFTEVGNPQSISEVIEKALNNRCHLDFSKFQEVAEKRFNMDSISRKYINIAK